MKQIKTIEEQPLPKTPINHELKELKKLDSEMNQLIKRRREIKRRLKKWYAKKQKGDS